MGGSGKGEREEEREGGRKGGREGDAVKCEWCGGSHMLNLAGVAATTGCAVGFTSTAG